MKTRHNFAFWTLLGVGALLVLLYLLGQTMAVIDYSFAESIGLQEPATEITEVGVAFNKGFGLGDTIVYIPLLIFGVVGLFRRSSYGFYSMIGALAITIYWPVVSIAALFFAIDAPGWSFSDYTSYTFLLTLIALYGLWGLWYLWKNEASLRNK